ncbi:APC family permease [Arthrobacter sp. GN70]|nr:APC family permease [Arthrobacter sp. GN70]MBT8163299.1 APC family permease [Arthrobacter sp. GN70]
MDRKSATNSPTPAAAQSAEDQQNRLTGNLGTVSLVLSVLAFSAPIVTVAGYLAFAIGFVGEAAPLAWIISTIVLMVFSIGYMTMTRHIPRAGAFYAYISLGLGRVTGVGSAYLATISYLVNCAGIYGFAGVTIGSLVTSFGGPALPWWACGAVVWIIVTTLGHFHIDLSAKVLGTVMVLEVILVGIFNVVTLAKGGSEGLSLAPLNPAHFINGGTGIALLFALGNFFGFEATALYRDEVRKPNRTIPRATYLAVVLIGLFYALSAYTLIVAFGSKAQAAATDGAGTMFNDALTRFVGPGVLQITMVLVTTSAVASVLSVHNVSARYLFNLSADHALPKYLSVVHPRHKSPYRASLTAAIAVAVMLAPFAITSVDPAFVMGAGSGIGTAGVLILMVLVSLAVFVWFKRTGVPAGESPWKVFVAPIFSLVILGAVVVFAIARFDLLVGGEPGQNLWMLLVLVAFVIAGSSVALYFKRFRPAWYARLGRATDAEVEAAVSSASPHDASLAIASVAETESEIENVLEAQDAHEANRRRLGTKA